MNSDTSPVKHLKYIPALDGLRAVSILFVLFSHWILFLPTRLQHGGAMGQAGVNIFFVISGYLITSQLVAEKNRTGTISISRFMLRRSLRLMPASLSVILAAVILSRLGIMPLTLGELIHGLTYTMDYYHPANHTLQHLWSLSVEEQFYLLWPVTILFLRPSKSRAVCWFLILACPLLRAWGWYFSAINHDDVFRRFEMVADALAIGAILSIYKDRLPKWTTSSLLSVFCFGLILLDCLIVAKFNAFPIFGITLNSVCSALIICSLTSQETAISRFLSWSPLAWLGTISYSVYLWQQLFLSPPSHPLLKLMGALAAATMSYYFVERPIRDWGRRVTARPKAPALKVQESAKGADARRHTEEELERSIGRRA